jgi:hypothetical protein
MKVTSCVLIDGLSDHDAQIIMHFNVQEQYNETPIIRNFNEYSVTDFN